MNNNADFNPPFLSVIRPVVLLSLFFVVAIVRNGRCQFKFSNYESDEPWKVVHNALGKMYAAPDNGF